MISGLGPLDAYATDLARVPGRAAIGAHDAAWLMCAQVLWRMAEARDMPAEAWSDRPFAAEAETPPDAGVTFASDDNGGCSGDDPASSGVTGALDPFAVVRRLARLAATGEGEGLLVAVRALATEMEDAGALALAKVTLSAARRVAVGASPHARGLTMTLEARVARQLGDYDVAEDLYSVVGRLGKRTREPELCARAELGHGILARVRGNYPAARTHFRRVVRSAESIRNRELIVMGHQGLMLVALAARDFDATLLHGWEAFTQSAEEPDRRAELLINLGVACTDIGQHAAALASYLSAAEQAQTERVRFHAIAWAAVPAARLGDRDTVSWCTGAVEQALLKEGMPFERAQQYQALAEAWTITGVPRRAQRFLRAALTLAHTHNFHELVFELEGLERQSTAGLPVPPPVRLAPRTQRIVHKIRALPTEHARATCLVLADA